jgi:hypothetical protein
VLMKQGFLRFHACHLLERQGAWHYQSVYFYISE